MSIELELCIQKGKNINIFCRNKDSGYFLSSYDNLRNFIFPTKVLKIHFAPLKNMVKIAILRVIIAQWLCRTNTRGKGGLWQVPKTLGLLQTTMTINDVKSILGASYICGEELGLKEVHTACGCDMMSDVLAFVKDQSVLLTGLTNAQVIRTAEMMDIVCIVFVRGKYPDEQMIHMAKEAQIALLSSEERMFTACGQLYVKGLHGGELIE